MEDTEGDVWSVILSKPDTEGGVWSDTEGDVWSVILSKPALKTLREVCGRCVECDIERVCACLRG